MISNFAFLEKEWKPLYKLGEQAERYVYSDPNSCMIKLGLFCEALIKYMFVLDKLTEPDENSQVNRINMLKREGLIPREIDDILYSIRVARNKAVHDGYESESQAAILLELAFKLSIWFMQTYGDLRFKSQGYIQPKKELIFYKDTPIGKDEIEKEISETVSEKDIIGDLKSRKEKAAKAAFNVILTEAETRFLIDEQLRQVGWEADTEKLRYSKGTRPKNGRNLAIAEWPTNSTVGDNGYADYALFIGLKLVGIVEAKRKHIDIPSVLDVQCRDYAKMIKDEHNDYLVGNWGQYKVPFLFATNGRKYLKQLETKSGIWYLDARASSNIPRALQGWMSPEGIMDLIEENIDEANEKLKGTPYDLLRDPDGLNLRDYQIEAIEETEKAIIKGIKTILLSMATGTGKTRTIIGLMYRLIKTNRFKRILFLVDRNSLGEQALDFFKEYKIEDLMTLFEIYDIKELEDKDIDAETKIHVATVQSMVKRILYNESDTKPSVVDYDLIVVDEAHRGYLLDQEICEDELLYRDQQDFISKYRTVIEYFDAVKIAMTATPALHTTEIFGKPIYNYTYRRSVIEGYLVDYDAPHNILTELSKNGIVYEKGEKLVLYDPVTGEITNSDELEDELKFDVDTFNKQVITEKFNRTVLREISKDINPEGEGKTLIYAVDDAHADLIVKILKEIYEEFGVDNEAIMKITGSIGGGNKKKVLEAIKRFKNEKYPNIAVTVDLLTTGIDVPEICNLVFIRRIKSRILFEQMIGRATRLCPEINKTHFEIYDAVSIFESLASVNTMKPVVVNSSATFEDLLNGLETIEDEPFQRNQIDIIIAKLQRKKRNLSKAALEHFIDLSGGKSPEELIKEISKLQISKAKDLLLKNRELFRMLNEGGLSSIRPVIISDKEDALLSHTRGYGKGKKPEDYLSEFKEFINANINKIAALKAICTKPQELTREGLKSLKLELDRNNFSEVQLNSAWKAVKNEDIAADIISLIRQQALGSPLVSHEQRVKNAVAKLRKKHDFSKMELDWLNRIETSLIHEDIVDKETFEIGAYKTFGGFNRINKIFRNQLENIIDEINDYLYEDGSVS